MKLDGDSWLELTLMICGFILNSSQQLSLIEAFYMPRFPGLLNIGLWRGTPGGDMTPPTTMFGDIGLTRGIAAPVPTAGEKVAK